MQALVHFLLIYLGGLHGGSEVGLALKPLLGHLLVVVGVPVHHVHVEEPLVVQVLDVADDLLALYIVLVLLDEADVLLLEPVLLQFLLVKFFGLLPLLFLDSIINETPDLEIRNLLIELCLSFYGVLIIS